MATDLDLVNAYIAKVEEEIAKAEEVVAEVERSIREIEKEENGVFLVMATRKL